MEPAPPKRLREGGPQVFRIARWYQILSIVATLMLCAAGTYYFVSGTNIWYRAGGVALVIFGLAAFADVLVSRIIVDEDAIHLVSLVRKRSYPRADFESATVDAGAVCLKRRDGGWLVLPGTGSDVLSQRNTIHAWINAGRSDHA